MKLEYHDQKIFDAIRIAGKRGAIEPEIRKAVKLKKAEVEPAIEGLLAGGLIVDSGAQRPATARNGARLLPVLVTADVAQKTPQPRETPTTRKHAVRDLEEHPCPACSQPVVHERKPDRSGVYLCDPQKRLVVFAGPYDENGCCTEPLNLLEADTGRYVSGRAANESERKHFGEHKSLDGVVPWTIGRRPHMASCERWDRWISRTDLWDRYNDIENGEQDTGRSTKE